VSTVAPCLVPNGAWHSGCDCRPGRILGQRGPSWQAVDVPDLQPGCLSTFRPLLDVYAEHKEPKAKRSLSHGRWQLDQGSQVGSQARRRESVELSTRREVVPEHRGDARRER